MRIAVNALFLVPGQVGGTETYLRRLLAEAPALLAPGEELLVFANAENAETLSADLRGAPRTKVVPTGVRAASRVRRVLFENLALPRSLAAAGADVLWNPGNAAPLRAPCPQVTTVHDMQYRRFPEDFPPLALAAMRLLVPAAVRRSARTIAVSEFSRSEILSLVPGASPERVVAVPEAADPFFAEDVPGETVARRALELAGSGDPLLLVVSNSYPHKSLETAALAFGRLCGRFPHRLLVVGRPRLGEPALAAALAALPDPSRAVRIEYASRADLAALYRAADLLLFPSRYEGFGLPVLEAMSAGLPVVAAREGSVPEVAGDAALYARAGDPEDFARAASSLLSDPAARARLSAAGRERAALFSWRRAAERTLDVLRSAAAERTIGVLRSAAAERTLDVLRSAAAELTIGVLRSAAARS